MELALSQGTDVVVQLKGNHPHLLEAVHRHCLAHPSDSRWAATEKRHGRYEYRQVRAFALPPGSGSEDWHDHFVSVLQVTRVTQVPERSLNGWHTRSSETAYCLSTAPLTAAQGAQIIRAHWHIESAPQAHGRRSHDELTLCA
ncbi:MAG: hypothetical protein M3Z21_05975 [Pseudomonadota bacterium]|nr:hypothetical protein [Pseudomonadota bacterium]